LIVVLPRSGPTDSMWIEIGAVRAWNKPIFGVSTDPPIHTPPALSGIPFYVPGRLDELINAIKSLDRDLSEADASVLAEAYEEIGESVDRLILEPKLRQQLVQRFTTRTRKEVTEERLLSELLRMRKQKKLKPIRSASRS
jgi:hypothetical protein